MSVAREGRLDGPDPSHRFRSLWPLPGGAARYLETLIAVLDVVSTSPSPDEFAGKIARLPGVRTSNPSRGYLSVLSNLGFVDRREGRLRLTSTGKRMLDRRSPQVLRDALQDRILGVTEILDVLSVQPASVRELQNALRQHGIAWKGPMQLRYRIWWMHAAGLIVEADQLDLSSARRYRARERPA